MLFMERNDLAQFIFVQPAEQMSFFTANVTKNLVEKLQKIEYKEYDAPKRL